MATTTTEVRTDVMDLSLVLEVKAKPEQYRAIINSIKLVRASAQKLYAALFAAQAAGAAIQWGEHLSVKPDNKAAATILEAAFGKAGKTPIYPARQWFLDHLAGWSDGAAHEDARMYSFVWDELRANVESRWKAKDPEFTKANRGYLSLNGVRRLAVFAGLGIGFPAASARPRLESHSATLTWDREIGPVALDLGTMDPGRWFVWRRIVSGEWAHGTCRLTERDGKLKLIVSYKRPVEAVTLDPTRTLTVRLGVDADRLQLAGPDGAKTSDYIILAEAADWLRRLAAQSQAWEARRAACGSPRREWGEPRRWRGIQGHLDRITLCREQGQQGRNHAWARRVAAMAKRWECGTVVLVMPDNSTLAGMPWQWARFASACDYKLKLIGAKCEVITESEAKRRRAADGLNEVAVGIGGIEQ